MKYLILLLSIIVFSFLLSCEDEKITNPKPDAVSPHITSIIPDSAHIGDIVTIIGTDFGATQDTSKVSFTGADASVYISWDSTEIKVKVPAGAQSGKVTVTVNGIKSNEVDFWVKTQPISLQITSIVPDSAYIGDVVTIIGTGFGTTHDTSKVSFTGADATAYTSWDSTEIKVKVPSGAESGKVSVTVNGTKSNEVDFWVQTNPFIKDTVKICDQVWMTKNLDVDHYRNGDPIPEVTNPTIWKNLKTGAWCYYKNDHAKGKIYGKLYNWYAVNDPRGLAPQGWHIPTNTEWKELEKCLGGSSVAGGKLKSTGTIEGGSGLWASPNTGATNETGFSALPCGYRDYYGIFDFEGDLGFFWSATENYPTNAWSRYLGRDYSTIEMYEGNMVNGFSVRCLRDY